MQTIMLTVPRAACILTADTEPNIVFCEWNTVCITMQFQWMPWPIYSLCAAVYWRIYATRLLFLAYFVLKQEVLGRTNRLLSFDTTRTAQKRMRPTIFLLLSVFVAAGTCLPRRCLSILWGLHMQTHRLMGGIYEVRCSDGLYCHDIPHFIKIGSSVQKLIGGIPRQHGDCISLL
jgi:hypothetical protein